MKPNVFAHFSYEEAIDWKESEQPLIIPWQGESIAIMTWENPDNSQGHTWWVVKKIRHAIWRDDKGAVKQKVMIHIEPEPVN